jgi:hypothetical protein
MKSVQIFRVVVLSLMMCLSLAVNSQAQEPRGLDRFGDRADRIQRVPASMEVTPVATLVMMGLTVPVAVILKDASGVVLPDTFPVSWSSSDPTVAEVGMAIVVAPDRTRTSLDRASMFGRVITGGRPGTALITAQAAELSASMKVTVTSSTSYYNCDSTGKCTCTSAQDCDALKASGQCKGAMTYISSTVGECAWLWAEPKS